MTVPWPVRVLPALAYRAWFTPPPARSPGRDPDPGFEPISVVGPEGEVSGYSVGEGPLVLAIHGWGGRASQMASIARGLAAAGYRVVAADIPGHAGGPPTDPKGPALAVRRLVESFGEPVVVVAHSFGNPVTRLAFSGGAPPPVVVLLAPLIVVTDGLGIFTERLGLAPWVRWALERRLRRWDPEVWQLVNSTDDSLYPGAELLIVHDPADHDTPFDASERVAGSRPSTELVVASGLGHAGILHDDTIIDQIAQFISLRAPVV